jgi:hypothetical protein
MHIHSSYYIRQIRGLLIGLNKFVKQFVENKRLNDLNRYLMNSTEEHPKQLNQNEMIEI